MKLIISPYRDIVYPYRSLKLGFIIRISVFITLVYYLINYL